MGEKVTLTTTIHRRRALWVVYAFALLVLASCLLLLLPHLKLGSHRAQPAKRLTAVESARSRLVEANRAYSGVRYRAAAREYRSVIEEYKTFQDPKIGEQVARARSNLAYCYARRGDFRSAADAFKAVTDSYHGTRERIPGQGWTVVEDARLQRAVCLNRLGRKKEALSEFEALVASKPSSQVFVSACDYIRRLNGGELTPKVQAALERTQKEAEKARRRKMLDEAMCGPKALAYVLNRLGVKTDYKEIAKLAGTGLRGTTMDGLAEAARAKGCAAVGLKVTENGLKSVRTPALALIGNHFIAIEDVRGREVELADVSGAETRRFSVPADKLFKQWQGYVLQISLRGDRHVQAHEK